jgi:hypothetical protein
VDPQTLVPVDHIEPAPRRIRAPLAGRTVFDTTDAIYVWEWSPYPRELVIVRLLQIFAVTVIIYHNVGLKRSYARVVPAPRA